MADATTGTKILTQEKIPTFLGITQVIPFSILMSPLFIASYLLISSFFNKNLKGLLYLIGMVIAIFFGNVAKQSLKISAPLSSRGNTVCNMFFTFENNDTLSAPDMNVLLISYSMFYIITNMFVNGNVNLWPIVLFSMLIGMTAFYKYNLGCCTSVDIVSGVLLGLIIGIIYFFIIKSINDATKEDLLYFGKESAVQEKCKKTQTKFVCKPRVV